MDKSKTTKVNKSESNSDSGTAVKYEQSVYLRHRKNQSIDYKWGGKYYRFEAYERKKLPKEVLKSRKFDLHAKNFVIEKGE